MLNNFNTFNNVDLRTLQERQQWTLDQKIYHSLEVIDNFIARMDGKVYLAFSGGKDSTVLMHLCEMVKQDILCVFVNTGCESPSILKFVREMKEEGHNIMTIRPKMTPKQVWEKYGFPLVSKQQAHAIHAIRTNPNTKKAKNFLGMGEPTMFLLSKKWQFLLNTKYESSDMCCMKLKKEPSKRLSKELGLAQITGVMACESLMRQTDYIRGGGCNVFSDNILQSKSMPLSIWMEDDIWEFIKNKNIRIADDYSQGVLRTGCVCCGFGTQFADDTRLEHLYKYHPKYYDMVMNFTNNGVTYREALREVLSVNGLSLPDEQKHKTQQLSLFCDNTFQ